MLFVIVIVYYLDGKPVDVSQLKEFQKVVINVS